MKARLYQTYVSKLFQNVFTGVQNLMKNIIIMVNMMFIYNFYSSKNFKLLELLQVSINVAHLSILFSPSLIKITFLAKFYPLFMTWHIYLIFKNQTRKCREEGRSHS